jgi:PKD repeat protein
MNNTNIKYTLPLLFFAIFNLLSCKKDSSLEQKSVLPNNALTKSQAQPTANFTTDVQSYYIDNAINFKNTTASPTLEVSYEWYEIYNNTTVLIATTKEIEARTYSTPKTVTLKLIATNKFGTDTFLKEIKINDKPKSAYITAISLDSVNYINPLTSTNWNASGGPNVFYRFYDLNQVWIDSTIRSANNNLYGWASAFNATQSELLLLSNVTTTPISWYYPSALKYIQFSKMLEPNTLKIYNKNPINGNEIIATIPFTFIDYFRANGNTTDNSIVKLRTTDGTTVITIKIKYNT